jgi:hypothetical protein
MKLKLLNPFRRKKKSKILLMWIDITNITGFKNRDKNSCTTYNHPIISCLPDDIKQEVIEHIEKVIDLIRDNGDMDIL